MSSNIGSMNNVKIFVLYLMRNINYPMDFTTINDIVMQNDYVMYLDFAEAFHQMVDGGLIIEDGVNDIGAPLYVVSQKGALIAETLKSDLRSKVLERSMMCALRYLDFKARGVVVDCTSQRLSDGTFDVFFTLTEKGKEIFSTKINTDSEYRATKMRQTFRDRPDVVYRGVVALLCGNVDYLFENHKY